MIATFSLLSPSCLGVSHFLCIKLVCLKSGSLFVVSCAILILIPCVLCSVLIQFLLPLSRYVQFCVPPPLMPFVTVSVHLPLCLQVSAIFSVTLYLCHQPQESSSLSPKLVSCLPVLSARGSSLHASLSLHVLQNFDSCVHRLKFTFHL